MKCIVTMRIDLLHYALIAIIFLLCIVLFNSSRREGVESRFLDKAVVMDEIKATGVSGGSEKLNLQKAVLSRGVPKSIKDSSRLLARLQTK